MKPFRTILLFLGCSSTVYAQTAVTKTSQTVLPTTVCAVAAAPYTYNNKLVKVRGYVESNFEYSLLIDEHCPKAIWFSFADGSAPPGLVATVNGTGTPGSKDSRGRRVPPMPVHLVRDENLEKILRYWAISAKGIVCAERLTFEFPPDCTTYRVTATFTGRIDGISKQVQEERRKRGDNATHWMGFGHMGMFDAQIVVQSVEEIVVVEEDHIRSNSQRK